MMWIGPDHWLVGAQHQVIVHLQEEFDNMEKQKAKYYGKV